MNQRQIKLLTAMFLLAVLEAMAAGKPAGEMPRNALGEPFPGMIPGQGRTMKPTGTKGTTMKPTGTKGTTMKPTGTKGTTMKATGTQGSTMKATGTKGTTMKATGTKGTTMKATGTKGTTMKASSNEDRMKEIQKREASQKQFEIKKPVQQREENQGRGPMQRDRERDRDRDRERDRHDGKDIHRGNEKKTFRPPTVINWNVPRKQRYVEQGGFIMGGTGVGLIQSGWDRSKSYSTMDSALPLVPQPSEPAYHVIEADQCFIVIEGDIDGACRIVIRQGILTMDYITGSYPKNMTVNGMPWNVQTPLLLNMAFNYQTAECWKQTARGNVTAACSTEHVEVMVDDSPFAGAAHYRITLKFNP